jgi:hypothetical protein
LIAIIVFGCSWFKLSQGFTTSSTEGKVNTKNAKKKVHDRLHL